MPSQPARRGEIDADQTGWLKRGLHFASIISLVIALTTYLFNLWVSRSVPSLSADSLIYHLTIPALWRQEGFLHRVDLPFHDGAAEHSPLFTETIIYALMQLTGNDDLAWLVQPSFFLLLVAVFYSSIRLLKVHIAAGRFLAACILLFPPFFHSSLVVNSEMVMTSGVAVFCFGMLLTRTQRERGCYLAAAGIALTFASKTIGVVYGSLALVILLGWLVAAARSPAKAGKNFHWRRAGIVCAALLLLGLMFHLRNLWVFGNPLYPAELKVAGLRLLPGRYDPSVFVNHGWSLSTLMKMLVHDDQLFAMKQQFGAVLWLAMLAPLSQLAFRRLKGPDLLPASLFVIYPLASILIYFAVTPFWAEHRLLFPVYYLLWGGLAWSLHLLTRSGTESNAEWLSAGVGAGFAAFAVFFLFYDEVPFWLLGIALVLGVIIANYPALFEKAWKKRWLALAVALAIAIASSPWWHPPLARKRAEARATAYPKPDFYGPQGEAWNHLAELTAGKGATVAYAGNALTYPLFGPRQTNRVVYLPLHPQDRPTPIELTSAPSIYLQLARHRREQVDEEYWLGQLREQNVNFLILVDDPTLGGVQPEQSIAARHPELLPVVFKKEIVTIHAVKRDF